MSQSIIRSRSYEKAAKVIALKLGVRPSPTAEPQVINSNRFAMSFGDTIRLMRFDEIIRIQADGNYTQFYFEDGRRHMVPKTLKSIFNKLPEGFLRIHQSHVIQQSAINQIVGYESVELIDGSILPIARSKKHLLKSFIKQIKL